MTHASMFSPIEKHELQGLSRQVKRDLLALLKNKFTVIRGTAQLTADDDRAHQIIRQRARTTIRLCDETLDDIRELFGLDKETP